MWENPSFCLYIDFYRITYYTLVVLQGVVQGTLNIGLTIL